MADDNKLSYDILLLGVLQHQGGAGGTMPLKYRFLAQDVPDEEPPAGVPPSDETPDQEPPSEETPAEEPTDPGMPDEDSPTPSEDGGTEPPAPPQE